MAIVQIGYKGRVANDTHAPNRIRELREAIGMSQAELARRANAHPTTLNKLELGSRGLDQRWMRQLAPILGVTPAELLPREDNPHILAPDEREMIERFRAMNRRERETFERVTEAVLPYRGRRRDEAA